MAKRKNAAPAPPPEVSIVVPLLNEDESLPELFSQILSVMEREKLTFEAVFVDDGSTDRSFEVLKELKAEHPQIKIIRMRRNYGKSAALSVGFEIASAPYVITMDADLQDDPNEIPFLIKELEKGYDLVSGWKKKRYDPISKTIPSKFFNYVTSLLSGIPLHDFNCGLKGYRREVIKGVQVYGELHRYIPVLAHWQGYKVTEKVVEHHPRKYGKTKFGLSRFFKGFLDLLTVLFTTRYINRPLHLFGVLGIVFVVFGMIVAGYLSFEWLLGNTSLSNRPLFIVGLVSIITGVQFISLGLIGEMINKQQPDNKQYSIRDRIL